MTRLSTLQYETPQPAPLDVKCYRTALFCGSAPLLTGVLLFVSWLPTRATWLELAGLWTIVGGVVLCGIGVVCLLAFLVQVCRQSRDTRRYWWPRLWLAGLLLVANFPVCYAIIAAVLRFNNWGNS